MNKLVELAKNAIILTAGVTAVVGLVDLGKEAVSIVANKIKK